MNGIEALGLAEKTGKRFRYESKEWISADSIDKICIRDLFEHGWEIEKEPLEGWIVTAGDGFPAFFYWEETAARARAEESGLFVRKMREVIE